MKFKIIWSKTALKQMERIPRPISKRIYLGVGQLTTNPYRHIKKIVNSKYFRLRVGDYRIILDVENNKLQIMVVNVGHRKKIYKEWL